MQSNKLTAKEKETINYYTEHSQDWRVKHKQIGKFGRLTPEFKLLFKTLSKGKIIEIGTGTGEDAKNLIKHYGVANYVGVEPSEGLRKVAIENNPKAQFIDTSIYDLKPLKGLFDGFWLSQMLIHIPKNRINQALKSLGDTLKKQSVGMISILEGEGDSQESRPGRFYALYNDKEFSNILKANGFEIFHKRKLETGHSPWLIYFLQKAN